MADYNQLLYSMEVHSAKGIQEYFRQGGDPNEVHNGVPLFTTMVEMYTRTPAFKDCVKTFVNEGLYFEHQSLLAVFLDDAQKLEKIITGSENVVAERFSIFKSTYTPLLDATLLHFCAEYNAVACAKLLILHGADVNARAGIDEHGFGGHTPIIP